MRTNVRPTSPRSSRRSRQQRSDRVSNRVEDLIADIDAYLDIFDEERPFGAEAWRLHRQVIGRVRGTASIGELTADDSFIRLLYRTLQAWGMDSRAAKLLDPVTFAERIRVQVPNLTKLASVRLDSMDEVTATRVQGELWSILSAIRASATKSFLVGASKTVHHLLPDLMPPMDRRYTYWFFAYPTTVPPARQERVFAETFPIFRMIAARRRQTLEERIGTGMHTSVPKTIDNAIIGYGLAHQQ